MKDYKRIAAAVLAVAVSAAATGSIAYAKNNDKSAAVTSASGSDKKSDTSSAEIKAADGAAYKDETVYVLCNSDSSVKDVVVSDWLNNTPALDSLSDISDLTDIEM